MKSKYVLAVKFFTETKNEEQLNISYKEIHRFLDTYTEFIWFYSFDLKQIEEDELNTMSDKIK